MIRKVTLQDYRGHQSTDVPLSQFTLLVGDNGVGKSSVLDALFLTGQSFNKHPNEILRGRWSHHLLLRSGAEPLTTFSVTLDHNSGESFKLEGSPPNNLAWYWKGTAYSLTDDERAVKLLPKEVQWTRSSLVLRLEAAKLASPSEPTDTEPRVEYNGEGLPTALAHLKLTQDAQFARLEEAARRVIPNLSAIGFEKKRLERFSDELINVNGSPIRVPKKENYFADALTLSFNGSGQLPATSASEGTLLALGLLTILHLPKRPNVILIDDIDRGLHPRAQQELVAAVRRVLKQIPGTQIVATSHSPYLVDAFERDEVVVLSRDDKGAVRARALSTHPNAKTVKTLSTGEFLNASGQDWFGL